MRALLAVLLVASAAHAWEPSDAASVDTRRAELESAWAGKEASEVLADKLQRSRQPRPAWVARVAWTLEEGARRLYFGVGQSSKLPPAAVKAAELKGVQGRAIVPGTLDWYLDETAGMLYALVVEDGK